MGLLDLIKKHEGETVNKDSVKAMIAEAVKEAVKENTEAAESTGGDGEFSTDDIKNWIAESVKEAMPKKSSAPPASTDTVHDKTSLMKLMETTADYTKNKEEIEKAIKANPGLLKD